MIDYELGVANASSSHPSAPWASPRAPSSPERPADPDERRVRATLWTLSLGNFVIGTGTMIVAGLLNVMAADLNTSVAAIGQLIAGYGLAVCIGAPILASLTSTICRRRLLFAALLLFAAGHLLAAFAPDYGSVLVLRVFMGFGAAIFTPQAAATAGLSAPLAQRGRAIALVFLGFSVANVLGTPIGIVLGGAFGWRISMFVIGVLAVLCALLLRAFVPKHLHIQPIDAALWGEVWRNRPLLLILATTLLQAGAQFVLIAYLAAVFAAYLGAGPTTIGLLFAWVGTCGVVGNLFAGSLIDRIGPARVVTLTLVLMLAGMLLWPLTRGSLPVTLLALGLWGLGCFAANSAQQARLLALSPRLAPASVALNSSSFYLGQAAGAAIGGLTLTALGMGALSWVGAAILLLGFASSSRAQRGASERAASSPSRQVGRTPQADTSDGDCVKRGICDEAPMQ